MAIKSSGPLGIDTDITKEIDHIDINDDGSIDLSSYYGRYVKADISDFLSIYYTPEGQIPEGFDEEPLPMGASFYGVEVVYEFTFNQGLYNELSLDTLITGFGWNRRSPVVVNLGSNFLAYSRSITKEALRLDVTAPYVVINLSGAIMGKGGMGGSSFNYYSGTPLSPASYVTGVRYIRKDGSSVRWMDGEDGGPALRVTSSSRYTINILGNGWIGGGGGGGAGFNSSGYGDVGGIFSFLDDPEPRYGGGGGGAGGGQGGAVARDAGYYAGGGRGGGPRASGTQGGQIYGGTGGAGGYGAGLGGNLVEVRKRENRAGAGGGGGRNTLYASSEPGTNSGIRPGRSAGAHGGIHGQPGGNSSGFGGRGGPSLIYDVASPNVTFNGSRVYGPKVQAGTFGIDNYSYEG